MRSIGQVLYSEKVIRFLGFLHMRFRDFYSKHTFVTISKRKGKGRGWNQSSFIVSCVVEKEGKEKIHSQVEA